MENSPTKNPSDLLVAAQLEKLRLEIERLRSKNVWEERVARYTPLLTVLITVAGFSFGVYQFRKQQDQKTQELQVQQNQKLQELQQSIKTTEEAKLKEFTKPVWEKQLQLYFEASAAAATLSRSKDPSLRKKAEETFWQLYQGPLAIVETKEVSGAMAEFGDCLEGKGNYEDKKCSDDDKGELSLILASTIQQAISKDWKVMVGDLPKDKYDYRKPEK